MARLTNNRELAPVIDADASSPLIVLHGYMAAEWLQSYNEEQPHQALAGLPPAIYRAQLEARTSHLRMSPWRGAYALTMREANARTCRADAVCLASCPASTSRR